MLEIKGLTIRFQSERSTVYALNGVNMNVPAGTSVAIVGESGSGKSTAMMSVLRLLPTTAKIEGKIEFQGRDILSMPSKAVRKIRGNDISIIFQNPSSYMNPIKTVGDQLIEPMLFHHLASKDTARKRATELLEQVGIPDAADRLKMYPFEFSGGMLQRVMIAMALVAEPKLLIADEPTTALDVTVQAEILMLLKRLQRERQMSLVFITHDLAVAAQVADEIYVMYGGLVMEHIKANELLTHSTHPYLKGLIASIPKLDGPRERPPYIPGQPINTTRPLSAGCIFADRCSSRMAECDTRPSLETVGESHDVACWLAERGTIR